jgi:hypothetical protein
MLENFANFVNILLENIYLRSFLFMMSGVFMGYTLQPVPEWLNHLFNTSVVLKFWVLFLTIVATFYPMDPTEMSISFVCCALTLILFHIARRKDVEKKMKQILNY